MHLNRLIFQGRIYSNVQNRRETRNSNTAPREYAIRRLYRFAEHNAGVSHDAPNPSSEEVLVTPIDAKASIDPIV
jgi:hypothetical protein